MYSMFSSSDGNVRRTPAIPGSSCRALTDLPIAADCSLVESGSFLD
jgi:hypothetical protein